MEELKLFVWKDALYEYTAGIAVVLAHDALEAVAIMERDFPKYVHEQLSFATCEVYTKPRGFYVYGGG